MDKSPNEIKWSNSLTVDDFLESYDNQIVNTEDTNSFSDFINLNKIEVKDSNEISKTSSKKKTGAV
jgi:hypothetical protein